MHDRVVAGVDHAATMAFGQKHPDWKMHGQNAIYGLKYRAASIATTPHTKPMNSFSIPFPSCS